MKKFRSPQRPKKSQLVVGLEPIVEEIKNGQAFEKIFVDVKAVSTFQQIRTIASSNNIPISMVPAEKLKTFNVENHQGIVALRSKISYYRLEDLINWSLEQTTSPLLLMLDGITDIRNIGGLARTALCTGVHGIIIPEKGVGALNEDAILTSAGALEQIAICRTASLLKAVDEVHAHGFQVIGSEMTAAQPVYGVDLTPPTVIIMGGEEKGIHPAVLKACDLRCNIPMQNNFESLNVSVAAGMVLYEAMLQRSKARPAKNRNV